MIPGMNPRQMQQAMKRLGIQQQDIEAQLVTIETADKIILIKNPSVAKVNMMGQETFQISGEIEEQERSSLLAISDDDVKTVMEQAGVDEASARKALEEAKGDIAAAILSLNK